jgi:hypothetical protein
MTVKKSRHDLYWEVVQEQYDNILFLYRQFARNRPVMLFDIQEQRVYAYPYRGFAADLSEKSQKSLARQYRVARTDGNMVVFVRDNVEEKLVSYTVPVRRSRTRHARPRTET